MRYGNVRAAQAVAARGTRRASGTGTCASAAIIAGHMSGPMSAYHIQS